MIESPIPARRWEDRPVDHWRERWGIDTLLAFERVGSTNDVVRQLAEDGAPAGVVAIAEEQTAGRGQAGRRWHAAKGQGLLLSILLRPAPSGDDGYAPGTIPIRVGIAVARAIEAVTGARAWIKWPNDILDDAGRKLAGVLCEGALNASSGGFVVAGIGVNVAQREEDFPPDLRSPAASLLMIAGHPVSRARLAGEIVDEVRSIGDRLAAPLDAAALREFAGRDALAGHPITIDGKEAGIACGLAADGSLLVRTGDAPAVPVRNGTVRVVRQPIVSWKAQP
jgi:BirA family biotin operon repressor/biotin-[acetyl-CoA-carboxylase] ligase